MAEEILKLERQENQKILIKTFLVKEKLILNRS
jgi:hypothetical protein